MLDLLFALALAPAASAPTNDAPCWIEDAVSSGGSAWLLCDRDQVLNSQDGGKTWRSIRLPTSQRLRAIAFAGSGRGFIAGDNGVLLVTEDGGANWREAGTPVKEHLRAITFAGDCGWIAGYGGTILHSADAGRTWTPQMIAPSISLEDIFFRDEKNGWAVGWNGAILRTTDGGRNWRQVKSPAAQWTLSSVYFRDLSNGWAVGMSGHLLRTRDGGLTWENLQAPSRSWFTSVFFDARGRGWITADSDILVSEDGGDTWRSSRSGEWFFFERVLPVGDSLWAVGPFGILQTDGSEVAWRKLDTLQGSG